MSEINIYWTGLVADDGSVYFDEKHIDGNEYKGPLITTASVVRGVTAFAAIVSGKVNVRLTNIRCSFLIFVIIGISCLSWKLNFQIPGTKMLGLAKFLLSIGVPGTPKDLFNQIESLSCIENNR